MGIPAEEEGKQGIENLSEEIMTENFPNLVKGKDMQVQKAQRVPHNLDLKIIIKMARPKDNERTLKTAREKQGVISKGVPITLSSDFSTETFQARREWCEIFKVVKSKDLQPRLLNQQGYHLKLKKK